MLSGMLAEACSGLRTLEAFNEVRLSACRYLANTPWHTCTY